MPSTSPAQKHLMSAVSHGWKMPGGGGPSVAVAKEFNRADAAMNKGYSGSTQKFAQGGPVLGKDSAFLKTPNEFTEADHKDGASDEDWGKGNSKVPKAKDKSLPPVKPKK